MDFKIFTPYQQAWYSSLHWSSLTALSPVNDQSCGPSHSVAHVIFLVSAPARISSICLIKATICHSCHFLNFKRKPAFWKFSQQVTCLLFIWGLISLIRLRKIPYICSLLKVISFFSGLWIFSKKILYPHYDKIFPLKLLKLWFLIINILMLKDLCITSWPFG